MVLAALALLLQVPSPATARPPAWVNLGAADSGAAIRVDAANIETSGERRRAWFRLTNPRHPQSSNIGYHMEINCTARTLDALAFRQYDSEGRVLLEGAYGSSGEGSRPAEAGSVMELAFLALCT